MDLSVVVVSWNTRELLRSCLGSIEQTIHGLTYEVVVVDNGSTDGSGEMVEQEFPEAVLLRNNHNLGFARANNQAMRASRGRYILLLNSDATLQDRAAATLVQFLDANRAAGAVGGKLLNPDGTFQGSYADFPGLFGETLLLTGLSRWLLPSTYPSYPEARSRERRSVDWVSGACLAVRRRAIDAVGLLDEDYFMYSEEVDWCHRLKTAGWSIHYLPDARVIHRSGGTSRQVPKPKRAQLYRGKWLYFRKRRGWLYAVAFRVLVGAVSRLKLRAWWICNRVTNGSTRDRAGQNVESYRYLLANF
ncbi:MAG TPA: glycosyltransferase family 2 protein [Chloroflexota bacterium]|nr:glycosyltransferase family 2 protein [Chloroflexota bacterium]